MEPSGRPRLPSRRLTSPSISATIRPAQPVGEPPEDERPYDRAGQVAGSAGADLKIAEAERRLLLQHAGQGSGQRDLQSIEQPGDAERHHHPQMPSAPGKAIQALGN